MAKIITCPEWNPSKEERLRNLFFSISEWVYSDALKELIEIFDGESMLAELCGNFTYDIEKIHDFVKRWDYRQGRERWEIKNEPVVQTNEKIILEKASELGLRNSTVSVKEPDFILPLGGARMSNYVRTKMARSVIDENNWSHKQIIALSTDRKIQPVEKEFTDRYAPCAQTEYDAICKGLEKSFDVVDYEEKIIFNQGESNFSAVRMYLKSYNDSHIYAVSAPSSDPKRRRANSLDTFNFFIDEFNVDAQQRILLITNDIYVPFQLLKFADLAIEGSYEVECIGSDRFQQPKLIKASSYLQEIKATIDVIKDLNDKYHGMLK